jgi:8-oxo-dGTP pyrophosphatase MutT (NUDIX family)
VACRIYTDFNTFVPAPHQASPWYHAAMIPPEPRHAASLIVLRQAADGARILMARRSAGHRFMPHRLVFPGGAVDAADFIAMPATPLPEDVSERLQRSASPALAQALGMAACRELTEELGLSLGMPPRLDQLSYLCRAITPQDSPIRFDARFFIVPELSVTGTPAPSRELEAPAWYSVEAALVAGCARPTQAVLLHLQHWLQAPPAAGAPVPVLRERVWTQE